MSKLDRIGKHRFSRRQVTKRSFQIGSDLGKIETEAVPHVTPKKDERSVKRARHVADTPPLHDTSSIGDVSVSFLASTPKPGKTQLSRRRPLSAVHESKIPKTSKQQDGGSKSQRTGSTNKKSVTKHGQDSGSVSNERLKTKDSPKKSATKQHLQDSSDSVSQYRSNTKGSFQTSVQHNKSNKSLSQRANKSSSIASSSKDSLLRLSAEKKSRNNVTNVTASNISQTIRSFETNEKNKNTLTGSQQRKRKPDIVDEGGTASVNKKGKKTKQSPVKKTTQTDSQKRKRSEKKQTSIQNTTQNIEKFVTRSQSYDATPVTTKQKNISTSETSVLVNRTGNSSVSSRGNTSQRSSSSASSRKNTSQRSSRKNKTMSMDKIDESPQARFAVEDWKKGYVGVPTNRPMKRKRPVEDEVPSTSGKNSRKKPYKKRTEYVENIQDCTITVYKDGSSRKKSDLMDLDVALSKMTETFAGTREDVYDFQKEASAVKRLEKYLIQDISEKVSDMQKVKRLQDKIRKQRSTIKERQKHLMSLQKHRSELMVENPRLEDQKQSAENMTEINKFLSDMQKLISQL